MAQTKSKKRASKSASSPSKSKSKPQSKSKAKAKPKSAKSKSAKARSAKKAKPKAAKAKSPSNGSSGGSTPVEAVRNAVGGVGGKAKGAGQSVGKVASKAKVPLVAGGAAIAGAAGGLALAASKPGRKKGLKAAMPRKPKVKIKSGDVAKAAKEVGNFSTQVGELASELQRARESAKNGKHRSPVEVVLQGLTARR